MINKHLIFFALPSISENQTSTDKLDEEYIWEMFWLLFVEIS